jgi:hypothetical protein
MPLSASSRLRLRDAILSTVVRVLIADNCSLKNRCGYLSLHFSFGQLLTSRDADDHQGGANHDMEDVVG